MSNPAVEPGHTIAGRYRIECLLGQGAMGSVYRAVQLSIGRPVALKCLHTNLAGDPDIRRRFAREARVLRSYQHPNVIQVYDFVEFDYLLGIVMEVVEGPSLVQYLSKWRGRMPLGDARLERRGPASVDRVQHERTREQAEPVTLFEQLASCDLAPHRAVRQHDRFRVPRS